MSAWRRDGYKTDPRGMWDEAETWHDAAMEEDLVEEDLVDANVDEAGEEDGVEMDVE